MATLVLQGLTFPALIRKLDIRQDEDVARDELRARKAAARAAIERIDQLRGEDWTREDSLDRLRALHEFRYRRATERAGLHVDGTSDENLDERSLAYQRTIRDVLDVQRHELERLRAAGEVSDATV